MRVAVIGATGRMGLTNCRTVLDNPDAQLVAAVEGPSNAKLGEDIGRLLGRDPLGLEVSPDLAAALAAADAAIDFTTPEATMQATQTAADTGCPLVIGTTGLSANQQTTLADAATRVPMVFAANMSLGINLLMALVERVATSLDRDFDIEVLEMHHRHKVDAPSGTALALGEAAARGRDVALDDAARRVRDGQTGPREVGTIGFGVLRGGDVVGDHTVVFAGQGERLELTHRASDRSIYARGALTAARWLQGRPPGLYGMADVLGMARE